jgi:DnaB-like helicase C terminal domain
MLCRLIAPQWLSDTGARKVLEGEFSNEEIKQYNAKGYGIYYFPNCPDDYNPGHTVDGTDIDVFNYCFVDMDLKDGKYATKEDFIEAIGTSGLDPSSIVDSGNGVHIYWKVTGLDANSYLRLSRRLMRLFNTDEAVGKILQLMRLPGTMNTKTQPYKTCIKTYASTKEYTCEELHESLPPITAEDEEYCIQHYNKTYLANTEHIPIPEELPSKFGQLLSSNKEVKDLWTSHQDDRSKADYRLGHLMFASRFTRIEALSVLINSSKALQRAPLHRRSYAQSIVDKIWTSVETASDTVRSILNRGDDTLKGIRFPCNRIIDDTVHGFRLGHVLGIIGGSGVGKTTLTLNCFLWFAEANPDYHHFFFSLEQPPGEIADRIKTICQGDDRLFDKIHIVSNYDSAGTYKNLSLDDVERHLSEFQSKPESKVGAVVVDHIGVLSKSDKNGESEGLMGVCRKMKAVAVKVNCLLIMLSQAPREKAGVGDLELNKDAAFGTVFFESFVDFCMCIWQPLKRVYSQGAPTVMAFKFAKIRHKKQGKDRIQEDTCYQLYFDPATEKLRELTQDEETAAKFFSNHAILARKRDRKTDVIPYESRKVIDDAKVDSH